MGIPTFGGAKQSVQYANPLSGAGGYGFAGFNTNGGIGMAQQPEFAELAAKNAAAAEAKEDAEKSEDTPKVSSVFGNDDDEVSHKKSNSSSTFAEKFGDRSVNADNKGTGMLGGIRGGAGPISFGQGLSGSNGMGDSALDAITANDDTKTLGIGHFMSGLGAIDTSTVTKSDDATSVAKDDSASKSVETTVEPVGDKDGYYGGYRW